MGTDAIPVRAPANDTRWRRKHGTVILIVLVLLPSLALLALYSLSRAEDGFHRSIDLERRIRATYLAEAGLHVGLQTLTGLPLPVTGLPYSLVAQTPMGEGSFQVELFNDAEDEGGATDTNRILTLRATGLDANGSHRRVLEAVIVLGYASFPSLPGAFTLGAGATAVLSGNMSIDGFDGNGAAVAGIAFETPGQSITENGSIQVHGAPDYAWASSAFTEGDGFFNEVGWFIERLSTAPNAVHFASRPTGNLGTVATPQVTIIDAGASVSLTGSATGAGILVVLGSLSVASHFEYDGLILVAQGGTFDKVSGNAAIRGGIIVMGASDTSRTPVRFIGRSGLTYARSAVDLASSLVQAPAVRSYLLKN